MALQYWVDAANCLAQVDDAWRAFAIENGAPELASPSVLGRPIASFCSDPTTTEIWGQFFARARAGVPVSTRIRCDAPEKRRLLALSLANEGDRIRVTSVLLTEEERGRVALLDAHRPHADTLLRCCGWCKRWKSPSGAWVEVERLTSDLDLFRDVPLPRISHGICEECRADLARTVRERVPRE